MCGICGAYAFSDAGKKSLNRIQHANEALIKRGPDGGAVVVYPHIALGHRRLSIIDVTCAGDQPMHSVDGRYTIVFNGEIFNYRELREKHLSSTIKAGLRSSSDTEVLLNLYALYGTEAFSLLQGFFALAIYDRHNDELVLARDRFGKKPLLYHCDENRILFASEMKALFAAGLSREINWNLLPVYLQLNYVPQPYSLVADVQKLGQGSFLKIKGNQVEKGVYYQLAIRPNSYSQYTYEQAKEKLVQLMGESVKLRLVADVNLGAFLSGGIDSSVVVALAAQQRPHLHTFSIGYRDNTYFDETSYARLVADQYKTEHTVFSLSNNDFLEHVTSVLDYLDEPFADSSAIPVFILSHYVRKHVTVALSGDGGDELFAGYNKHGAEHRMRRNGIMNGLMKVGYPVLRLLPKSRSHPVTNKFRQIHRYAQGARLNASERYWQWSSFNTPDQALSFLSTSTLDKIWDWQNLREQYAGRISGKDFNEVLLADMNLVLLSDMLPKIDLMSMANSLEIRSPFLDQNVVDFAFGLPSNYKIDGKLKKKIVQDAFRNHLPPELYNRPKRGFEIPLLGWFRKELWGLIDEDLLADRYIQEQGIFDPNAIKQLKRQLRSSNPGDAHATIWALLVFQHWYRHYIDV